MKLQSVESELPSTDEPKDPLRRRLCKDDFPKFCLTYHADIFFDPVSFHYEMCADLQRLILAPGHKRMARAAPRGVGKCLGRGTPVLMFDGTTKAVEDIHEGDQLMGPDSSPRNVSGLHRGFGPLFKIESMKGDSYIVNENHILSMKVRDDITWAERRNRELNGVSTRSPAKRIVNLSVSEFRALPTWKRKDYYHGWKTGVEFSVNSHLPLEPYLLGAWLGDGSSNGPEITTEDAEVLSAMEEFAGRFEGLRVTIKAACGNANTYRIGRSYRGGTIKNDFLEGLRACGVYGDKHIPHAYKTASRIDRLDLLAGIIDTDGYCSHGCFDIVQKNKRLAHDVVFLARSLGLCACVSECQKTCANSKTLAIGTYHRITISGNTSIVPVRIPRKKASPRLQFKDPLISSISATPIGNGEFFGFELDGDHLFLLGDFTVTHNTTLGILATEWAVLYGHKRCAVWFCVNEAKATERADSLQGQLLTNRLLSDDFPEICAPLKVEGKTDWVSNGKRIANGAWLVWRSIDGGNLGTLLDFQRPDFVVLDDIEDTSTIRKTGANTQSVTAQKRFDRIDKEICFLPERGKGALLLITTIRSRGCLSDEYCDVETKAAWEGRVYSAIDFGATTPERDALWNSYLALCGSKDSGKEPPNNELWDESQTLNALNLGSLKFNSLPEKLKRALCFFAANEKKMRAGITELDPIRIPVWDFFWQVGSDSRGKEIVWSELQNQPLDDPFTKQMRFTEKQLWTHQVDLKMGEKPNGNDGTFVAAIVVGSENIHYELKHCRNEYTRQHLLECGSIVPILGVPKRDWIEASLDGLRKKWTPINLRFVAVDISAESGRDKGEWSEIVAQYCATHRPWIALQDCDEWDSNQAARARYKNFCVEMESNPFGIVKWHSVHYKNRLAAAYNNPEHPITFFKPDECDDILWKYIRSQTSEQYTLEFIPDKTAKKSKVEKWTPVPKFRNMTHFWKTAAMIECLADITISCKPRERHAAILQKASLPVAQPYRRQRF